MLAGKTFSGEGFSFNIVNELLSDYLYKHHIVYIDNYYTSLKIARYLLLRGTDLIVTTRRMARRYPRIDTVFISQGDNFKCVQYGWYYCPSIY